MPLAVPAAYPDAVRFHNHLNIGQPCPPGCPALDEAAWQPGGRYFRTNQLVARAALVLALVLVVLVVLLQH